MESKRNIYTNFRTTEAELDALDRSNASPQNKELAKQFKRSLLAKGRTPRRLTKILWQLRTLFKDHPQQDFAQATKSDIEAMLAFYREHPTYAPETKKDYKRILRQLYRWYRDEDPRMKGQPDEKAVALYAYIGKMVIDNTRKVFRPEDIITKEDIDKVLLNGCRTAKERAFIALLHESGCRIEEFMNIQIKGVNLDETPASIIVNGKTGERRIPTLIDSVGAVADWLRVHPDKSNPDAFLWVCEDSRRGGQPMHYIGAVSLIKRTFKRAGVTKRHNAHSFRHARATIFGSLYPDKTLNQIFGWSASSGQSAGYVHLGSEDVANAVRAKNGMVSKEKENNKPILCGACRSANPFGSRYCYRCGKPCTLSVALDDKKQVDTQMNETVKLMMQVFADPDKRKDFEAFLERVKEGDAP